MSNLYGDSTISSIDEMANSDTLLELFMVDDLMRASDEEVAAFMESAEAELLMEKSVLKKPTLIRMSKQADFNRRLKLCAYYLAKSENSSLWTKLVKAQTMKKAAANAILKKYGKKAARLATISQKNYVKKAKAMKATAAEQKAQSATK